MYIFGASQSLEITLGGAPAANQLQVTGSYVTINTTTWAVTAMTAVSAVTNSGTVVTLVPAPGVGTVNVLKELTVYNADTANVTVNVSFNDNTTVRQIIKAVMPTLYTINYNDNNGWK
jgi:O-glycosyl hydrolase